MNVVQLLIDLKNADPTALTAKEAIQTLLGFGDRLGEIRRRQFYEVLLESPEETDLDGMFSRYLEGTVVFWNPNKHRAWARLETGTWEALPGARRRASAFGAPGLEDPGYDHILVWTRGEEATPADLVPHLAPARLVACGRADLFSLRWVDAGPEDRVRFTEAVAVARSRGQGLLVNPHFQDHWILQGAVPAPFWGTPHASGV